MPTDETFSKTAVIVGGSCRMALDLLPGLRAQGVRPVLTYRNPAGEERIRAELEPHGHSAQLIRLDFTDFNTLANLTAVINQGVAYLVDFAQSDYEALVAGADERAVGDYFSANLSFRAALLKRVARGMLVRRSGRMVYVSSTAAARPNPGQGFYAAAKLGAEALYRNLGLEMASKGISTAVIRPGYVAAGRGKRYLEAHPESARRFAETGQVVASKDISEAILYLLLKAGAGVNGAVLTVDGGLTFGK